MLNRLLASFGLAFIVITAAPLAQAADIPVLTWEKGKEHNIVLGGNSVTKNWKINLVSEDTPALAFHQSKVAPKGYVVFSVTIPDSFPTGVYRVETAGANSPTRIVAGIKLVDLSSFNLIQIPTKLIIILLTLVFLVSTMSIIRMKKYERIEYLRSKPVEKLDGFLNVFYKFRFSAVDEIHKSLFKFQLIREGELLHKISPATWALLPIATIALGGFVGINGNLIGGVSFIPMALYTLTAVIGVIDPFSGFTAAVAYAFTQSVTGNVTSVRSVMSLLAVGIGWVAPGILSSLYQDILRKDRYFKLARLIVPDVIASIVGGFVFLVAELLTNSFANHIGVISVNSLLIPLGLSVAILGRIHLYRYLVRDLHQTGENYQIRIMILPRVLSPRTILFASAYFAGTTYVWTESLQFAGITAFLLAFPLSLLMVRFESPVIKSLAKRDRHILLETLAVCTIATIAFFYVQSLPLEVTAKGKLLILYASVILFIHGFYSSIFDTSSRSNDVVKDLRESEMV
jgi:hypothetical protein